MLHVKKNVDKLFVYGCSTVAAANEAAVVRMRWEGYGAGAADGPLRSADESYGASAGLENEFGFIVVFSGRHRGDIFKLDRPRSVIGHYRGVHIYVDDSSVGAQHASIRYENDEDGRKGEFVLHDLDSESGTFVNDVRVDSMLALRDGDAIRVGQTILIFKRI